MVLASLAIAFRRIFQRMRRATLTACHGADMESREEQCPIQDDFLLIASDMVGDRQCERAAVASDRGLSSQSSSSRVTSMKRKLDELEYGTNDSSLSSCVSQVRPRREARENLLDMIATQSIGGHEDAFAPAQAHSLDLKNETREDDGNVASHVDAAFENLPAWDVSGSGSSKERSAQHSVEDGQNDSLVGAFVPSSAGTATEVSNAHCCAMICHNTGFSSESIVEEMLGSAEVLEKEDLGSCGREECESIVVEDTFAGDDLAHTRLMEEAEPRFVIDDASTSTNDSFNKGHIGNPLYSTNGSLYQKPSCASISNGVCFSVINSEDTTFNTQTRVQFFVRTYLDGGRTIVLHSNLTDTVEFVKRQIALRIGVPISEQRLIYRGRQLQDDQTLVECGVDRDSTLHLVARMRSTTLPQSWQLANEVVKMICGICATRDQGRNSRLMLMQTQENIRSAVRDFLKMAAKSVSTSEHIQVFRLAGATFALVMLLLSPVETNRECGEECIKLFLFAHEDLMPAHIHCFCAPILLDFCKLLVKNAPDHTLYPPCRNALAFLLDTVGIAHGCTYFNEAEAESIVCDFAPFVNELSLRLLANLERTAVQASVLKDTSLNFAAWVKEGQDFTSFVIPLCKAMEGTRGIETSGQFSSPKLEDVSKLSYCQEIMMDGETSNAVEGAAIRSGETSNAMEGAAIRSGFIMLELGSRQWLQAVFRALSHGMGNCLEAVEVAVGLELLGGRGVEDDRPFGLAPFLIVLKGLHSIAKLYDGSMDELLKMLNSHRMALNLLIRQSRWQEDHFWLLEHKSLLDFESKRRLVMGMLQEPQEDHDERHDIVVQRSHLLSESFEKLAYEQPDVLQGGISVEFATEEATGPGVVREWFSLVCRDIFNPQNALFLSCPNDRRRVFPNPASGVNPGHLTYFRFCGRFVALALMHKVQIDVVFALIFYKQLAGLPISWKDTQDVDPCLYESCKKILEMNDEFIDSDVLGLTFMTEIEELGIHKKIDLCPGGGEISVNSENRSLYVELLVQRRFVSSVTEQVKCFSQGFSDLLVNNNHQQFLGALDPEEFDMMLYGKDRSISLEDWKAHTEYHEYSSSDEQITWFWQVVEDMTMEQRRRLLFFSTSVKHLPIEGFSGLSSKFHIHKAHTDIRWLPTAHTCFYQLVLPPYSSFDMMNARLHAVIEGHIFEGFGFA